MNKRKSYYGILWYVGIFAFFYIWFTQLHPLVVFDADDWTYIAGTRRALPMWGAWNPSRIFPEVVMPKISTASVFFLRPFGVDYLTSLMMGHAISVSACITLYAIAFAKLMKRISNLGEIEIGCLTFLFLVLHFLAFRSKNTDNLYLFATGNVTCYYYYIIPDILNASLVMYMMENPCFDTILKEGKPIQKGFLLLATYLLIFSNLPAAGILAVYAGAKVLLSLLGQIKTLCLKNYVRENIWSLVILAEWMLSAVCELSGGRAASLTSPESNLISNFKASFSAFLNRMLSCNKIFLVFCVLVFVVAVMMYFLTKNKGSKDCDFSKRMVLLLICTCVMFLYLFILSLKAGTGMISRVDCLFGVFFFALLMISACCGYVFDNRPELMIVMPLILCVMFSMVDNPGVTFDSANMGGLDPVIGMQISNDLVEQTVTAEENGLSEMDLYVPDWKNGGNWPHSVALMPRLSKALVEHGILRKPIVMNIIPSEAMNEKYGIIR